MSSSNEKVAVSKELIIELISSHRAYLGATDLKVAIAELEGMLEDDTVEDIRDPNKVYIVWCWDDVQNLKPDWSPERCQTALDLCSKVLESRSVEEGWTILGDLLVINEDEIEKAVSPE